jgi:uncharacterized protein (DUF952 family)
LVIYKILTASEWACLQAAGRFDGAPVDLADGYIHFSTAGQVAETLRKHFADADDLVLAGVRVAGLGDDLRWEPSRGGALFPHLYRALLLDDIVETHRLGRGADGAHRLPPPIADAGQ